MSDIKYPPEDTKPYPRPSADFFLMLAAKSPEAVQILQEYARCLESMCEALSAAHDEILSLQGMKDIEERRHYDWPEWSYPANSVRWAEKLLGKKLAKTDAWTMFPEKVIKRANSCGG